MITVPTMRQLFTSGQGIDAAPELAGAVINLHGGAVVLDGSNKVESMLDTTANGNDVTQATPTERPAWVENWRNGRSAIQGPGQLVRGAYLPTSPIPQPGLVYVAGAWQTGNGNLLDGTSSSARWTLGESGGQLYFAYGSNVFGSVGAPADNTPFIAELVIDGANGALRVIRDGGTDLTATGNGGALSMAGITVNSNRTGANDWQRPLAHFTVASGTYTLQQRADYISQLSDYYDIHGI